LGYYIILYFIFFYSYFISFIHIFGSMAEEAIKRIIYYRNPFDQIEVTSEETNEEVQKKYKKLALLIHPDKCKHPDAAEAFALLGKAMKLLEDDEKRRDFITLMEIAEKKIKEEIELEPPTKRAKLDPRFIRWEIMKETHRMIVDRDSRRKNAEKNLMANQKREQDQESKKIDDIKKQAEVEKKWEEGRSGRVHSWRNFQAKGLKKTPSALAVKPKEVNKSKQPSNKTEENQSKKL